MRIGSVFLVLSAVFGAFAVAGVTHGRVGFAALAWPSAAFLVVGAGYLGLGAQVFGKTPDGRLPGWRAVLLFPYFGVAWGVWRFLRLGKEPCWNEVRPGLFLGRRPYARELPPNTRLVVDLTAEFPRSIAPTFGMDYVCVPVLDGHVGDDRSMRILVDRIARHPGPVYVHCAQGHGRSAVVIGGVLLARGQAETAQEAERALKLARPGVHLSSSQREMLRKLEATRPAASR